jgi:FkbM family methyltransferase
MTRVTAIRKFDRVAGAISRRGLSSFPGVKGIISALQDKYFREFYDQSCETVELRLDGINLIIPRRFIDHYVFHKYEPVSRKLFLDSIRPGMTVVDAGAHIGYYAVLAAKKVGHTGMIHAIEPCDETATILKKNVEINQLDNVKVHVKAAGRIRESRMFQITGSSDSHGFYIHPNTPTLRTINVEQVPLDEIVSGPLGVVKIDVEGAEIEVLDGMQRILQGNPQLTIFAEWFPAGMRSAGRDPLELPEYIRHCGFSSIQVIDDHSEKIMSVDQVSKMLSSLPNHWYGNLYARKA